MPPTDPSSVREQVRQIRFQPSPGACDLLLVRHGESQPAVEGQPFASVGGHSDPPLDLQGHDEARRVADRLDAEEISAIYATTLQRTQQTAAPLAERLGLTLYCRLGLAMADQQQVAGSRGRLKADLANGFANRRRVRRWHARRVALPLMLVDTSGTPDGSTILETVVAHAKGLEAVDVWDRHISVKDSLNWHYPK